MKILARGLLLIASLVFVLIVMEIGLRIASPPAINQPFPTVYQPSENEAVSYEHIPNYKGIAYANPIQTNSLGLRDKEYEIPKPEGVIRVLVLGDSITYGFGVRAEETYAKQLEQILNESCESLTFEVINAGVSGYNIHQELAYLRDRGLELEPDFVILTFVHNDIEPAMQADSEGYLHWGPTHLKQTLVKRSLLYHKMRLPFHEQLRKKSFLFRFIELHYNRSLIVLTHQSPEVDYAKFEAELERAKTEGSEMGLIRENVIASYLSTYSHTATPVWRAIEVDLFRTHVLLRQNKTPMIFTTVSAPKLMLKKLLNLRDRLALPFLNFGYYFGSGANYKNKYSLGWDSHPNPIAHRLMAELLYEKLLEQLLPDAGIQCQPPTKNQLQDFEERYRREMDMTDLVLEESLNSITSARVDFKDPPPLQVVGGTKRITEFESLMVLLRAKGDRSQIHLRPWINSKTTLETDLPFAFQIKVNGRTFQPKEAKKMGTNHLVWYLPAAFDGVSLLEVEVSFEASADMVSDREPLASGFIDIEAKLPKK